MRILPIRNVTFKHNNSNKDTSLSDINLDDYNFVFANEGGKILYSTKKDGKRNDIKK